VQELVPDLGGDRRVVGQVHRFRRVCGPPGGDAGGGQGGGSEDGTAAGLGVGSHAAGR
jgi:hypothetical protein